MLGQRGGGGGGGGGARVGGGAVTRHSLGGVWESFRRSNSCQFLSCAGSFNCFCGIRQPDEKETPRKWFVAAVCCRVSAHTYVFGRHETRDGILSFRCE